MMLAISVGLFLMLMIGISLFGYRRYVRPGRVHSQVGSPVINSGTIELDVPREKKSIAVLNQIGANLPQGRKSAAILKELGMAGYRSEHALQVFQGARLVCVVVSFLFAFVMHL